jgi:hypothetical protein
MTGRFFIFLASGVLVVSPALADPRPTSPPATVAQGSKPRVTAQAAITPGTMGLAPVVVAIQRPGAPRTGTPGHSARQPRRDPNRLKP